MTTDDADADTGVDAGEDGGDTADGALSSLTYEQARGELVGIVQQLEAGGSTLEESLALWERGEELARICRGWLDGARARLDAVLEAEESRGGAGKE